MSELKGCFQAAVKLPGVVWEGWRRAQRCGEVRLSDLLRRVRLRLRSPNVSSERSGRGSDCEMSLRHFGFPLLMLQHRLRNRMLRQRCTKLHFCNPAEMDQSGPRSQLSSSSLKGKLEPAGGGTHDGVHVAPERKQRLE